MLAKTNNKSCGNGGDVILEDDDGGGDHYDYVIMGAMVSQITSLMIVYSTVYLGADQSKHQSSAPLAFVWGIHRGPGNSPHKWPATRKIFLYDDVIMISITVGIFDPYLSFIEKN